MSNVKVHTAKCECGRTVRFPAPEDDAMVLLSVERAQLAAHSTVEDHSALYPMFDGGDVEPSITDIPWRF